MFDAYPTYPRYRTLALTSPHQKGEDVYALQTALIAAGFALTRFGADGDLGGETASAIRAAQTRFKLVVDGLAGGKTQEALALHIAANFTTHYNLAPGALRGQLSHESGFRLGNYSPKRDNGSYDAGVAQRNTELFPAKQGFTVPDSIDALAARVAKHFALFEGVPDIRRRWKLAQGSWNAPAWACYLAKQEGASKVPTRDTLKPSDAQRLVFEAYMTSVSAYLEA